MRTTQHHANTAFCNHLGTMNGNSSRCTETVHDERKQFTMNDNSSCSRSFLHPNPQWLNCRRILVLGNPGRWTRQDSGSLARSLRPQVWGELDSEAVQCG